MTIDLTLETWTPVCATDRMVPGRGIAALVGGQPVAVFALPTGELFAVGNVDPCSGANVLSRGIVGDVAGAPTVASPMYKQRFDLRTGQCLDEADRWVPVYPVQAVGGTIFVGPAAA